MFCFSHFCCFCFRNKVKLKHLHEITCYDLSFVTIANDLIPELALSGLDSLLACERCTKRLEEMYVFRKNCSRNIQLLVKYAGELRTFGGFLGDVQVRLVDVGKSLSKTLVTYGNACSEDKMGETVKRQNIEIENIDIKLEPFYDDDPRDNAEIHDSFFYGNSMIKNEELQIKPEICDEYLDSNETSNEEPLQVTTSDETAALTPLNLLPESFQKKYKLTYKQFMDWRSKRRLESFSEDVLLEYFGTLAMTLKSSILWARYSMLKSTLFLKENIDVSSYMKLRTFLKRQSREYQAKKCEICPSSDIENFVNEAPDADRLSEKRKTDTKNPYVTNEQDDHESASESEASEINDIIDEEPIVEHLDGFVFDGTKWHVTTPVENLKVYKHDGFPVLHAKSALESWQAFFTDETLGTIVEWTNKQLASKQSEFTRDRDCRCTDVSEIKAFIGLLYMAGYYKSTRLNAKDLWSGDGSGVELFRLVMSRNRFYTLLSNLCFDDKSTRRERRVFDKLAAMRDVFDTFVHGCKTSYVPGQYVTVGETFVKFRGKCDFRQYIPSAPGQYGIKIYSLVDAKAFYTVNLEIHPGKQPNGPFKQSYDPNEVVKRLCRPVFGTGRNVTSDVRFTSYETATELLRENVTYVGAIEKNDKPPPTFAVHENAMLVSYVPKKGTSVLIVSTMHDTTEKTPEIITFYDRTKSSVDVVNKLSATYSVRRNTNRWTMSVFYTLLNVAAINAHVLYNEDPKDRRRFIKTLVMELVSDQLNRRSQLQFLPRDIRQRAAEVSVKTIPEPIEACIPDEPKSEKPGGARKRCYMCDRKKNRKTKYTCMKCGSFICLEHANYVCDVCKT